MGWWGDLLSNPTLDRSKMTAKGNGKRKGDWLQPATEWVSDATPNEFSKMNNQWTGNIPYIGWVLKGLASADNFSETYSNTGDLGAASQHGLNAIQGNASDPYMYSPKNQPGMSGDWSKDWAGNIGKMMNVYSSARNGNYGGAAQGGMGLFNKYDKNKTGYYPMTGVGVGTMEDPNYNGQGSGYGALLGLAGNYLGSKYGGQYGGNYGSQIGGQLGGQFGQNFGSDMNRNYQNAYSPSLSQSYMNRNYYPRIEMANYRKL